MALKFRSIQRGARAEAEIGSGRQAGSKAEIMEKHYLPVALLLRLAQFSYIIGWTLPPQSSIKVFIHIKKKKPKIKICGRGEREGRIGGAGRIKDTTGAWPTESADWDSWD